MSDERQPAPKKPPFTEAFKQFIPQGWADYEPGPTRCEAAPWAAKRREALSRMFPGDRLIIPAGELVARNGDTDFGFRPESSFVYLTGLGADREPGAVLVMEPDGDSHVATLYFRPRAQRSDQEFYADARYGEMWVGQRESLAEMSELTGLECAHISDLEAVLKTPVRTRLLRNTCPMTTPMVDAHRNDPFPELDAELETAIHEMRMVKDEWEIRQIELACARTAEAIEAVVAELPEAIRRGRGERWIEGVFALHARHLGNYVSFPTIAAAGDHVNTLHWVRNDGDINPGDMFLIDCGVEIETLYGGDISRTFPVDGQFTPHQRKVYDAVIEAHDAAVAAAKPGAKFSDVHEAAIAVIARKLEEWGVLPVSAEESLDKDKGGQHRRWMVHGTSHHLGLDVHDCNSARVEEYRLGVLKPGMVITVEPGIYFKTTDLLVPEELRGIGTRFENDVLITDGDARILSTGLPRTSDEVEAWMAPLLAQDKKSACHAEITGD